MSSRVPSPDPHPLGTAVLLGAQAAIGSAALLARAGLAAGLSPIALAAWRLCLATAVVWALRSLRSVDRPQPAPISRRAKSLLILAGSLLALHFVAWFASLQYIPVARSTLLVTTAPIWSGLGGILFRRERPSLGFWAGLAIAAIGMWLIVGTGSAGPNVANTGSWAATAGDAYAVIGAIAIAAYLLLTQPFQATLGTGTVVTWTYGAAAALTWLAKPLLSPGREWPANAAAWMAVIGMALVPQLIGHTSLNWSLRHFPARVVSAATLLEPVFAGALAWIFLHEPLSFRQLAGAAILLAGVGLALWKPGSNAPTQNSERPA